MRPEEGETETASGLAQTLGGKPVQGSSRLGFKMPPLVAEGLGVTVLPDYSVIDDALHRAGLIEARPIAGDRTTVTLVVRHRANLPVSLQVRELHAALVARAGEYRTARAS